MTQAVGALLVLVGAMMFYIASADLPHHSVKEIWQDFGDIASGKVQGG